MTNQLFLCEKPSQAKDISKVLGVFEGRHDGFYKKNGVIVTWAFGHILANAMPGAYGDQYKRWDNLNALPIIPTEWKYSVSESAKKQFAVIKKLLLQADEVIIATDADREGEVIGREILEYCGYQGIVKRFWTSGLDPVSIKQALAKIMPGSQTINLYYAGLARSRADWLVGMNLSRAYTVVYSEGVGKDKVLSIGRIQTPTLHLVVRRDAVIDNFKPYDHYGLLVTFQPEGKQVFQATWQIPQAIKNEEGCCVNRQYVEKLANDILNHAYTVEEAKTELKQTPAPLPFSLSALQKEASKRFDISTAKVLEVAQALYEKYKIISYPRTACQYLPSSQQADVPHILDALQQLDSSLAKVLSHTNPRRGSRVWNDTQVNKHSHHAIIPTMIKNVDLSTLGKLEHPIYLMIRNRYIAQFLPDYLYESTVILINAQNELFKATGHTPQELGWKAFLGTLNEEATENKLPPIKTGEIVKAIDAELEKKRTVPPARFTEATLLEEMCSLSDFLKTIDDAEMKKILRSTEGLGTEATRANIIARLFEVGYIEKRKGKIFASEKGKKLIATIPPLVADPVTTAKWELSLQGIENGTISVEQFLQVQTALLEKLISQVKAEAQNRLST